MKAPLEVKINTPYSLTYAHFGAVKKKAAHKMSIIVNVLIYSNKYHKVKIVKVKTVLVETP